MALVKQVLTRRQALVAAVAAGLGVGAVRLVTPTLTNISTGSGTDWASPLGTESARIIQLLRRPTFGYTPAPLESAPSAGYDKTVDRPINTKPAQAPGLVSATT